MKRPGIGLLLGISVMWIPLAFLFDGVTLLVLPIRLEGDVSSIGLASFLGLLIAGLVQPVAGTVSDRLRARVDRRAFMTAAAIPVLVGLWLIAGAVGTFAVVAGYVLIQVSASAVQAAQQSLLPEHAPPPTRGRAAGLKTAFDVGGSFLAFAVLGVLLASGDVRGGVGMIGLLLVVTIGLAWRLVPARSAIEAPRGTDAAEMTGTPLPPGFVPLVIARLLFLFGTYAVGRFLLPLVATRLALDPATAADETGLLLATFTLATVAGAVVLGWLADRRPRRQMMRFGVVVAAVGIVALVPSAGVAGIIVGGLLMAVGTAAFVVPNWAATADLVAPRHAGRLMAIANLGTYVAAATAGLLGPVIDGVGFGPALLLASVVSLGAILPLNADPSASPARLEGTT